MTFVSKRERPYTKEIEYLFSEGIDGIWYPLDPAINELLSQGWERDKILEYLNGLPNYPDKHFKGKKVEVTKEFLIEIRDVTIALLDYIEEDNRHFVNDEGRYNYIISHIDKTVS